MEGSDRWGKGSRLGPRAVSRRPPDRRVFSAPEMNEYSLIIEEIRTRWVADAGDLIFGAKDERMFTHQ